MAGTLLFDANEIASEKSHDRIISDSDIKDFKGYTIVRQLSKSTISECFFCSKDGQQYFLKKYNRKMSDSANRLLGKICRMQCKYLSEIVDYGEHDGKAYEIQKYYGDTTLANCSDFANINIITVIVELNKALAALHVANVLHNDIKPENIIISDGHCIITDYSSLTEGAGVVMEYSPEYAAPEVISEGFVSTATDYFSLGVTIYEAITGMHPFKSMNSYDIMNIKNNECWIATQVLDLEIVELIRKLCLSKINSRWQYDKVTEWCMNNSTSAKINSIKLGTVSEKLGTITWNNKFYERSNLSDFITDLASNWGEAIKFLFSGEHTAELQLYSPEIQSAIDAEIALHTGNLKGKSFYSILCNMDDNESDEAFLDVLLSCGIALNGVYWRGFKGQSINELALKMLNDCFKQYYSQANDERKSINVQSFSGSALLSHTLSKFYSYYSDKSDASVNVYNKIASYENEFIQYTDLTVETAFTVCYIVSGSKQFPLYSDRSIESINELHNEVRNALNKENQSDIMKIISRCATSNGLNAPFRAWMSQINKVNNTLL